MQSQTLIQTNHGVSYPLVGLSRMEQSKLDDQNEDVPDQPETQAVNSASDEPTADA